MASPAPTEASKGLVPGVRFSAAAAAAAAGQGLPENLKESLEGLVTAVNRRLSNAPEHELRRSASPSSQRAAHHPPQRSSTAEGVLPWPSSTGGGAVDRYSVLARRSVDGLQGGASITPGGAATPVHHYAASSHGSEGTDNAVPLPVRPTTATGLLRTGATAARGRSPELSHPVWEPGQAAQQAQQQQQLLLQQQRGGLITRGPAATASRDSSAAAQGQLPPAKKLAGPPLVDGRGQSQDLSVSAPSCLAQRSFRGDTSRDGHIAPAALGRAVGAAGSPSPTASSLRSRPALAKAQALSPPPNVGAGVRLPGRFAGQWG